MLQPSSYEFTSIKYTMFSCICAYPNNNHSYILPFNEPHIIPLILYYSTVYDIYTINVIRSLSIFLTNKNSYKEVSWSHTIEIFLVSNHCFPHQSYKSSRKTAMRHPVEQLVVNRRVKQIFCKRNPPHSSNEFPHLHWGYNFLWISAVLPVLWETVPQFNWVKS